MLQFEGVREGILNRPDNGIIRLGPGNEKVTVVLGGGFSKDRLRELSNPHAAGGLQVSCHGGPPGGVVCAGEDGDGCGDSLGVGGRHLYRRFCANKSAS